MRARVHTRTGSAPTHLETSMLLQEYLMEITRVFAGDAPMPSPPPPPSAVGIWNAFLGNREPVPSPGSSSVWSNLMRGFGLAAMASPPSPPAAWATLATLAYPGVEQEATAGYGAWAALVGAANSARVSETEPPSDDRQILWTERAPSSSTPSSTAAADLISADAAISHLDSDTHPQVLSSSPPLSPVHLDSASS